MADDRFGDDPPGGPLRDPPDGDTCCNVLQQHANLKEYTTTQTLHGKSRQNVVCVQLSFEAQQVLDYLEAAANIKDNERPEVSLALLMPRLTSSQHPHAG